MDKLRIDTSRRNPRKSSSDFFCKDCGRLSHGNQSCVTHTQTFTWKKGGNEVFLIGSWSQWQAKILMKKFDGQFTAEVSLAPGTYFYKFIVDNEWMYDKNQIHILNNLGDFDNEIRVFPAVGDYDEEENCGGKDENQCFTNFSKNFKEGVRVTISTYIEGKIEIKGSWDDWHTVLPMIQKFNQAVNKYENIAYIIVDPGVYQYKFFNTTKNNWVYDKTRSKIDDQFGGKNNIINVFGKTKEKIETIESYKMLIWSEIEFEGLNFSAVQGHSISCISDSVFIFGGLYHGKFLDSLYLLNISSSEVIQPSTKGSIPEPRAYHCAVVYGDSIIFYGGLNDRDVFNDLYVLDTLALNWAKVIAGGNGPFPRERSSMSIIGQNFLFLFGGYACSSDMEVEYNYNDNYTLDLSTMEWNKLNLEGDLPSPRFGHTITSWRKHCYLFGGVQRGILSTCFNDLYRLNFESKDHLHWEQIKNTKGMPPSPRYGHSAIFIDHDFLVIYGGRNDKTIFSDVIILDTITMEWIVPKLQNALPEERCYHACTLMKNKEILIFGGYRNSKKKYLCNFEISQTYFVFKEKEPGVHPKGIQSKINIQRC